MSTKEKALELLGRGFSQDVVASACGVTPSAISQLMASEEFIEQVRELRCKTLQTVAKLDEGYDSIETKLVKRLESQLSLIYKPGELLKAIQVVNGAKRRGQIMPEVSPDTSKIVSIMLPQVIVNKFTTNIMNQVVEVSDEQGKARSIVTASATSLPKLRERVKEEVAAKHERSKQEAITSGLSQSSPNKVAITAEDL